MSFIHLYTGILILISVVACRERTETLNAEEWLGKQLFHDAGLSFPEGQSCATCHRVERAFTDTLGRAVSEGAVKGLFSMRNSMTIAYSAYVPALEYEEKEETYVGGLFWDGRVNSLEEQAAEPFLNPVEMAAKREWVVGQVRKAPYFPQLQTIYGTSGEIDSIYLYITKALAAYEKSSEINPFSSKYDAYLAGKCELTEREMRGLDLFQNKGMCSECHIMEPDPRAGKVLFTDHTYDNLGIPRNTGLAFYSLGTEYNPRGRDTVDLGVGATVRDSLHYGKFRVPTLRNIAMTAPYGHNGYFASLQDIVHFYNVRDVGHEYPEPEYPVSVNREELGDLKLTPDEEACLVEFMETLTDGYPGE